MRRRGTNSKWLCWNMTDSLKSLPLHSLVLVRDFRAKRCTTTHILSECGILFATDFGCTNPHFFSVSIHTGCTDESEYLAFQTPHFTEGIKIKLIKDADLHSFCTKWKLCFLKKQWMFSCPDKHCIMHQLLLFSNSFLLQWNNYFPWIWLTDYWRCCLLLF